MNEQLPNNSNPEDKKIAQRLSQVAEQTHANPQFAAELEERLRSIRQPRQNRLMVSFRKISPVLRWAFLMLLLAVALSWSIKTLIPAPQPAAENTPIPTNTVTPTSSSVINQTTTAVAPEEGNYNWRGATLYLQASLPVSPTEANIYVLKEEEQADVIAAQALAEQLGIQGEVYLSSGLYPAETSYFITDGKQSLLVNSSRYFTYTADMTKAYNNTGTLTHPNAETIINDFLQAHGFDFPHKIEEAEFFGGYEVKPLSPDGFPIRYEFFSSRPMRVTLDENGQVLQLESNLMNVDLIEAQMYGIITVEEAIQKMTDDSITAGKIESSTSSSINGIREWKRDYPLIETITIYGYASSRPALDSARPSFIQIDGYTAAGNTNGIEALERNTFIEATGQFINENGIDIFNVVSWQISEFPQDGLVGTLFRENGQIILQTEQEQLTIQPNIPADISLPFENAFVIGIRKGTVYEWTLIDDRMISNGGGGGGGGGGLGFYKLNLSGTPVPFPTSTSQPQPSQGTDTYTIKEGDTLSMIAQTFGITVEELMRINGMTDPLIFVGQQLVIPGTSQTSQRIEGLRGTLAITIYKKSDGSQRIEYILNPKTGESPLHAMLLEGDNLQDLLSSQGRPVDIWGTLDHYDSYNRPVVRVERYEVPYPDLKIQLFQGTQENVSLGGRTLVLFTLTDGRKYILALPNGDLYETMVDPEKPQFIIEGMTVPNDSFEGFPILRLFNGGLAFDPNGEPYEMHVTADEPYVVEEELSIQNYTPPNLTITEVELVYFVSNPYYQVDDPNYSQRSPYIQPAWHFHGRYDDGTEFDILIQALKQEFLLPELEPYVRPG